MVKLFGEALRAQDTNHGSKETKRARRSPRKSARTVGPRREDGKSTWDWVIRSQAP